jgi:hypothetical protein
MRKTLITCDHCHKEIKVAGADGWLDIKATVTVTGLPTETIGPVDLCRSCFHDTMRNAGFAFTAAPSPALPNGRGVGGSSAGRGVVADVVARGCCRDRQRQFRIRRAAEDCRGGIDLHSGAVRQRRMDRR